MFLNKQNHEIFQILIKIAVIVDSTMMLIKKDPYQVSFTRIHSKNEANVIMRIYFLVSYTMCFLRGIVFLKNIYRFIVVTKIITKT